LQRPHNDSYYSNPPPPKLPPLPPFLNEYDNFKKVYIDEESGAIVWNEDVDIDPLAAYLDIREMTFDAL